MTYSGFLILFVELKNHLIRLLCLSKFLYPILLTKEVLSLVEEKWVINTVFRIRSGWESIRVSVRNKVLDQLIRELVESIELINRTV